MVESLEFDEKWQALKARFVERLALRFRDMDAAWASLQADPADRLALSSLFHLVHSLAGSGATFGYGELSAAARQVEPMIDPDRPLGIEPVSGQRRQEIAAGLDEIRRRARFINPSV